jgi:SAM-dependent methyltransferase
VIDAIDLQATFDGIDIYLFDQLLRGRITRRDRIVDAGCGEGRNLVYLLQAGYDVRGLDRDPVAIDEVRRLARRLAPHVPPENFRADEIEASTFPDASATVVICSAVLHFASDEPTFDAMLEGMWRLLVSGGLFFCRLASTIGMEQRVRAVAPGSRRYRVPDGTERFLVDESMLLDRAERLGGRLLDPIKTTVVQDQRSMTTWVLRKN